MIGGLASSAGRLRFTMRDRLTHLWLLSYNNGWWGSSPSFCQASFQSRSGTFGKVQGSGEWPE